MTSEDDSIARSTVALTICPLPMGISSIRRGRILITVDCSAAAAHVERAHSSPTNMSLLIHGSSEECPDSTIWQSLRRGMLRP